MQTGLFSLLVGLGEVGVVPCVGGWEREAEEGEEGERWEEGEGERGKEGRERERESERRSMAVVLSPRDSADCISLSSLKLSPGNSGRIRWERTLATRWCAVLPWLPPLLKWLFLPSGFPSLS